MGSGQFPRLARVFAVDLRSLGLFRMALAFAVLYDLAHRWVDLEAHYSDAGILPVDAVVPTRIGSAPFSVHLLSGNVSYQAGLFVLAALVAVSLLVGYRTRVSTIVTWFLHASLRARMPLILYGGDSLLGLLLFWSMFLPLGARFSLDARRQGTPGESNAHFSAASAALLLQVVFLYVFTALRKLEFSQWRDGSTLSIVLQHDWYASAFGLWVQSHGWLTTVLTYGTLVIEGIIPFVLLIPRKIPRVLGITMMVGLQLGMTACMSVGIFPIVFFTTMLPFIPSWAWDLRRPSEVPTEEPVARPAGPWLANAAVAVFIACGFATNISTLGNSALREHIPWNAIRLTQMFGLDQSWGMFAPDLSETDGWLVVRGTLMDGAEVNLLHPEQPFTFDKPLSVSKSVPTNRWSFLFWVNATRDRDNGAFWQRYETYITRSWNASHDQSQRLIRVDATFFHEPIPLMPDSTIRRAVLWPIEEALNLPS